MKKHINTSFQSFLKHKLDEAKKSLKDDELIEEPIEDENEDIEEQNDEKKIEHPSKVIGSKKKPKPSDKEYMSELMREYNKIVGEYDSLYKRR